MSRRAASMGGFWAESMHAAITMNGRAATALRATMAGMNTTAVMAAAQALTSTRPFTMRRRRRESPSRPLTSTPTSAPAPTSSMRKLATTWPVPYCSRTNSTPKVWTPARK